MSFLLDIIGEVIVGLIVGVLSFIAGFLVKSRKNIFLRLSLLRKRNVEVRVSLSYLYIIKIDNKYLLIKGNRIDQYQPVGGVYKYYSSFVDTKRKLEVRDEKTSNFYEEGDLRIIVKGKKLFSLIKWFETGKNREISVFREFYEELISSDILKSKDMENTKFEFVKREKTKLKYSKHFQMDELLIYDIIEVHLTDKVKSEISHYVSQHSELVLASSEEIIKECLDNEGLSTRIGLHAKYLL